MSNPNESTQSEPIKPVPSQEADEVSDKELEEVSGGRRPVGLNPQPLPPLV